MTFKHKPAGDGTMRLVDNASGRTVQKYYPGNAVSGGRMKHLIATTTLTEADNGSIFYLNAATEFVTTLPAPFLGAEFEFIVKAAPSGANYTIVTASSANIIKGIAFNGEAAGVGDSGSADDTITFVASQALAGDRVVLRSDGTSWFATAFCKVAAGITFTQAST
jgi:hypothetical protein